LTLSGPSTVSLRVRCALRPEHKGVIHILGCEGLDGLKRSARLWRR
jgi:hypothetical protein